MYGYENYWPRFSPDGSKVYFLSNQKADYGFKSMLSYSLSDTISDTNKIIRPEMQISRFYDIDPVSRRVCFISSKSRKSILPPSKGGISTYDLYIDSLPPDNGKFSFGSRKHQRQITFKEGIFGAAFSPSGNRLACIKRIYDRCYLAITDTSGKEIRKVYPDTIAGNKFDLVYSLDWSPDGRHIALSYFDNKARKIGIYDT
jgi:Tol biopolymer transport system component